MKKEEVEHVAKLARLALTDEEKERYAGQLSKILEHIHRLNELAVDKIEPTTHALPLKNVWREDQVKPSLPVAEVLSNAPDPENNFFKVPRILD